LPLPSRQHTASQLLPSSSVWSGPLPSRPAAGSRRLGRVAARLASRSRTWPSHSPCLISSSLEERRRTVYPEAWECMLGLRSPQTLNPKRLAGHRRPRSARTGATLAPAKHLSLQKAPDTPVVFPRPRTRDSRAFWSSFQEPRPFTQEPSRGVYLQTCTAQLHLLLTRSHLSSCFSLQSRLFEVLTGAHTSPSNIPNLVFLVPSSLFSSATNLFVTQLSSHGHRLARPVSPASLAAR